MKTPRIPEHRPLTVPSTLDDEALRCMHPSDLKRLRALRKSYYIASQKNSELAPLTEAQIDHLFGFASCGFSKHECLAELGLTPADFEFLTDNYPNMKRVNETVDLLIKSCVDRQVDAAVLNPQVNMTALKYKLNACALHNISIINTDEFAKMDVGQRAAHILSAQAAGLISAKVCANLLDSLKTVQELLAVPLLESQIENLQAQLD